MNRLLATIATDLRLQVRNGFYYATALVVLFSIALLRWLPAEMARLILPAVVLGNVLVNSFYFASGMLLLERVEGTLPAQAVTPLRPGEYVASKAATLIALSVVESLLIAVTAFGLEARPAAMAVGVALAAGLFCLAGIALVARHDGVNGFLMPSVLYTSVLSLPVLGLFGVGSSSWYLPHPVQGPLMLMQIGAQHTPGMVAYAISYPLLWMPLLYLWSRRAVVRLRHA